MKIKLSIISVLILSISVTLISAEIMYLNKENEDLLSSPKGKKIATVNNKAPLEIIDKDGDRVKVIMVGWLKESSLKSSRVFVKNNAFDVVDFSKETIKRSYNYVMKEYADKVRFNLKFKNFGNEAILSWSGLLSAYKKDGELLFKVRLNSEGLLEPGKTQKLVSDFEEHEFMDKQVFWFLQVCKKDELELELSRINIEISR